MDCEAVTFMDSTGINVLVQLYKSRSPRQMLEVRGLNERVRRVFDITGLATLLGCESGTDAAVCRSHTADTAEPFQG